MSLLGCKHIEVKSFSKVLCCGLTFLIHYGGAIYCLYVVFVCCFLKPFECILIALNLSYAIVIGFGKIEHSLHISAFGFLFHVLSLCKGKDKKQGKQKS